jgi:hypothetical protein
MHELQRSLTRIDALETVSQEMGNSCPYKIEIYLR